MRHPPSAGGRDVVHVRQDDTGNRDVRHSKISFLTVLKMLILRTSVDADRWSRESSNIKLAERRRPY